MKPQHEAGAIANHTAKRQTTSSFHQTPIRKKEEIKPIYTCGSPKRAIPIMWCAVACVNTSALETHT